MGAAGSDVAMNSASIALMSSDLRRLPFLVGLSRATTKVVWQNLIFGVCFVIVGLVLTGFGLVGPMLAGLLHFVSSVIVVFNSARMVRYGEDIQTFVMRPRVVEATETAGRVALQAVA